MESLLGMVVNMQFTKDINTLQFSRWLMWLMVLVVMFPSFLFAATGLPVYQVIENRATAIYFNPDINMYERVDSNRVELMVAAVPSLLLQHDESIRASIGQQIVIPHELMNDGNVDLTPTVTLVPAPSSHFSLNHLSVFIDENNNGIADPHEIQYFSGDTLPVLGMGQIYNLVVTGEVPNSVSLGSSGLFTLTITGTGSQGESATSTINDTIQIEDMGYLDLSKSASVLKATPDTPITYSIVASQSSNSYIIPTDLYIDGVLLQKVFVRDAIPVGTVFSAIAQSSNAQVLYHIVGSPSDNYYVTLPPDNLSRVDAVAFAWDSFTSGSVKQVGFTVNTLDVLPTEIINQAASYQTINGSQNIVKSNLVILPSVQGGDVSFYKDNSYVGESPDSPPGMTLFVGALLPGCNANPMAAESYLVNFTTSVSNDSEEIYAVETGPDTGFFVVTLPTAQWPDFPAIAEDEILSVSAGGVVTATVNCHGNIYSESHAIIDASQVRQYLIQGILFDSRNINQVVANATVELYSTTAPADSTLNSQTFTSPFVDTLVATTQTDVNGYYKFADITQGQLNTKNYRVKVNRAGYSYPSQYASTLYPTQKVEPFGSYGQSFTLSNYGSFQIDIPFDAVQVSDQQGLAISKEVNKKSVEYGQSLLYTIEYKNQSTTTTFNNTIVQDTLPRGFAYVSGTAKLDNTRLADPSGAPGGQLLFNIGAIAPEQSGKLTYQVQVRNSAPLGKATNMALLIANEGQSNTASVDVQVKGGVLSDDAFILGMIYADCNNNKQKDPGELGIPFVRMYLEDGTFVISDGEGRFSLYGLTPRTHVMKVDSMTLPKGAQLEILNNRFAGDAGSAFVDLKKGELHRTDFAISDCSAEMMEEIQQRREAWSGNEVNQQLQSISDSSLSRLETYNPGDLKARPTQGLIQSDGQVVADSGVLALPGTDVLPTPDADQPSDEVKPSPALPEINDLLRSMENSLGFIDLQEGDVLKGTQLTIRVKGPMGAQFKLLVNDKEIDVSRVGQRSKLASRSIEAWNYIGVNLQPGNNKLEVVVMDGFGNARGSEVIHVTAPDKLAQIQVIPASDGIADGMTPLPIKISLVDKNGVKTYARTLVTLESSSGFWNVPNSKPNTNGGIDTFIENGESTFNLIASESGHIDIRVSSGLIKQVSEVSFSPNMRPLIAVGVIEGTAGLRSVKEGNVNGVSNGDNFEESIRTVMGNEGKKGSVGLRGALFLKGRVKGDYLLTLSYDSDKEKKGEMFRDIDPNRFFPIYGDDSIRGFDAQSTSKVFARLDKNSSYLMYGDYATDDNTFADKKTVRGKSLGNYSRNLTGIKGHYENDRLSVNYFAAYDDSLQGRYTFAGRGISGPYDVKGMDNFVQNSEVVTVITRSKAQPSLIIDRVELKRFTDYTFDAFYSSILFARPIPSMDDNGNPIEVLITFEVDGDGDKYWVYGADGELNITDTISLGGSYVKDKNPSRNYTLSSLNAVFDITPNIGLALEMAESRGVNSKNFNESSSGFAQDVKGKAYRVELVGSNENKSLDTRVYITKTDKSFHNEAAGVTPGQTDAGVTANYRIQEGTLLHVEGIYSKDKDDDGDRERKAGLASIEQALNADFSARVGMRYVKEKTTNAERNQNNQDNVTSVFTRLNWKPADHPDLLAFVEGEQSTQEGKRQMLAVGTEYALSKKVSLYGRHEFISKLGLGSTSSASGEFGLSGFDSNRNATTLGVKYNYAASSDIYSEYRIANSIDGKQAEGAMGINNAWEVTDGLSINTSFERIQPFNRDTERQREGTATAVALGLDYTGSEDWKGTTRLEWRHSEITESWLHTVGLAYKLNTDWTALASNIYGYESSDNGNRQRDDARIGFAFRDTEYNRLNALVRYQLLVDNDGRDDSKDDSTRHVIAALANYQWNPDLVMSGRYALSRNITQLDEIKTRSISQLVMGRLTYDLNENWDIGMMGSTLFGNGARQFGYGAEVGYLVTKNVWFSVGYNLAGFRDDDLTGSEYTQEGAYLRLRIKFDENMFGWLTD